MLYNCGELDGSGIALKGTEGGEIYLWKFKGLFDRITDTCAVEELLEATAMGAEAFKKSLRDLK